MASYNDLYAAYYQAFKSKGVPDFEARQLADGMAATGGTVPRHLQALAQRITRDYPPKR